MKGKEIDFSTQLKIKNHLNFLWEKEQNVETKSEEEILNELDPNLKKEVLKQTLGKMLFEIPLFAKNFSKVFLEELLFIMKPVNFEANSWIYKV